MNRTLLAFMLVLCSVASAQIQYPYNPDGNFDGQIGASDILDILVLYGNDFALGTFQSDSNSAILFVGEMDFWDCQSTCAGLTGNWVMLDDLLIGTYKEILQELGDVWINPAALSLDLYDVERHSYLYSGMYVGATSRANNRGCVCQTRVNPLLEDIDPCAGLEDECGVCQGEGAIYECGCSDIPEGDCDCNGNQLDALGVCGGNCPLDTDGDGICDPVCGNGIVEGDEICDDGNDNPNDGCDGCQQAWTCGDALEYWGYFHQTVEGPDGRCWFAENLVTEYFSDGSPVEMITSGDWGGLSPTDKYCCLNPSGIDMLNFEGSNGQTYISLTPSMIESTELSSYVFNFGAVISENGLCPSGWKVPSSAEFHMLAQSVNGVNNHGVQGTNYVGCSLGFPLYPPSTDVDDSITNWTGFSALTPSVYVTRYGLFNNDGGFQTSNVVGTPDLNSEQNETFFIEANFPYGDYRTVNERMVGYFPVRCIKDQ